MPSALQVERLQFKGQDGTISATVVRAIPERTTTSIIYAPEALGRSAVGEVISLDSLSTYKKGKERERALLSGGFSSYRLDVPLGLLIVDNQVKSVLSDSKVQRRTECGSAASAGYRWSGVLCQRTSDAAWAIIFSSEYQKGMCKQALQAGPMLVEPEGKVAVCDDEPSRRAIAYERSAACIDESGRLNLVFSEATHLFPFAQWLARELKCNVALNLSGDSSAGLIYEGPSGRIKVGEGSPVVSAIAVKSR